MLTFIEHLAQLRDLALALVGGFLDSSHVGRSLAFGQDTPVEGSAHVEHVACRRLPVNEASSPVLTMYSFHTANPA